MKIYDSKSKEIKKLDTDKKINIYFCGPTIYSDIHIGNARPIILFDMLHRYLKFNDIDVTIASNVTDVDDKIINRAEELEISEQELTQNTLAEYQKVLKNLNVLEFDYMPKVTDYIDPIIKYIEKQVENETAYVVDGDVYFDTAKSDKYGEISNVNLENIQTGEKNNTSKKNPADFALWKKTSRGVAWDSNFSKGRPGWHTECVVMINEIFGGHVDIHGGGEDLKFPHHENENAQSNACGCNLAKIWMHNGFININNEKMSKSLNNFVTAKDFIEKYSANILRLLMLNTSYRQPLAINDQVIVQNDKLLQKLEQISDKMDSGYRLENEYIQETNSILENDFDLPNLLTQLYKLLKINDKEALEAISYICDIIGLKFETEELSQEIKDLIEQRNNAKKEKNFNKADSIREEILSKGYEIKDTREGTTWKKIK